MILIVVIGIVAAARPAVLADPVVSAAATAVVGAAAACFTKRVLCSAVCLRWNLGR
ncbi:hypothetical protein [Kitasatospora sp. NPDC097691]|uniref:hypothetical protein n=1 Tax=Kitasatospora sp. NPDC097691 TaxID=3157231 RepID=UPI00331899D9